MYSFLQNIREEWVDLDDVQSIRHGGPGVSRNVFPQTSDQFLGVVSVSEERGPPCLPLSQSQLARGVDVEIRVYGSYHGVPNAMDSTNHAEDINPSVVRTVPCEDSF